MQNIKEGIIEGIKEEIKEGIKINYTHKVPIGINTIHTTIRHGYPPGKEPKFIHPIPKNVISPWTNSSVKPDSDLQRVVYVIDIYLFHDDRHFSVNLISSIHSSYCLILYFSSLHVFQQ
jgi:hypothetical protein